MESLVIDFFFRAATQVSRPPVGGTGGPFRPWEYNSFVWHGLASEDCREWLLLFNFLAGSPELSRNEPD